MKKTSKIRGGVGTKDRIYQTAQIKYESLLNIKPTKARRQRRDVIKFTNRICKTKAGVLYALNATR